MQFNFQCSKNMENTKEKDDSWPWAPGMEYKHIDVSWLFDFSRPSTELHKVILQGIAKQKVKQEEEKLQHGTQELFLELQRVVETSMQQLSDSLQPNIMMPERYVNKFDLWQREASKYLRLLHKY